MVGQEFFGEKQNFIRQYIDHFVRLPFGQLYDFSFKTVFIFFDKQQFQERSFKVSLPYTLDNFSRACTAIFLLFTSDAKYSFLIFHFESPFSETSLNNQFTKCKLKLNIHESKINLWFKMKLHFKMYAYPI